MCCIISELTSNFASCVSYVCQRFTYLICTRVLCGHSVKLTQKNFLCSTHTNISTQSFNDIDMNNSSVLQQCPACCGLKWHSLTSSILCYQNCLLPDSSTIATVDVDSIHHLFHCCCNYLCSFELSLSESIQHTCQCTVTDLALFLHKVLFQY